MNAQKQFYTKLYSSSKTKLDTPDAEIFFENPYLSRLSSEASEKCEGKITIEECQNIIKTFQLGKIPGNDGLPIEFYNVFCSSIGEMVVESFNEAYKEGEMSYSLRQGFITLIEKTGKDLLPTTVDTKIASKVIATRITKILPEIIHSNQTGYVSGRFIGEAARSILDVMEYTKTFNIPGIFLFRDFEKAFDSLEWNFMFKCLEIFGFGHSVVRWVETFYSNVSSCTIKQRIFFC